MRLVGSALFCALPFGLETWTHSGFQKFYTTGLCNTCVEVLQIERAWSFGNLQVCAVSFTYCASIKSRSGGVPTILSQSGREYLNVNHLGFDFFFFFFFYWIHLVSSSVGNLPV